MWTFPFHLKIGNGVPKSWKLKLNANFRTRIQSYATSTKSTIMSYVLVCGVKRKHLWSCQDIEVSEEEKWISTHSTRGLIVLTNMNKSYRGETWAAYWQMAQVWPAVCNRFQALVIKPSGMITNRKNLYELSVKKYKQKHKINPTSFPGTLLRNPYGFWHDCLSADLPWKHWRYSQREKLSTRPQSP